jgi:hypothetical protein
MELSSSCSPFASAATLADGDVCVLEVSSFWEFGDSSAIEGVAELGSISTSERRSDKLISPLKYTSNASS